MSIKRHLLSGGTWVLAAKIVAAASTIAVNGFLARLLDPKEVGIYFLVFSLVSIIAPIGLLGVHRAVVRLIAAAMAYEQQARARMIAIAALLLSLVGLSLAAAFVAYGAGDYLAKSIVDSKLVPPVIEVAAIWIIVFGMQLLLAELFRGFHDLRSASIFGGPAATFLFAICLAFIWLVDAGVTLTVAVSLAVASATVATIFSLLLIARRIISLREGGVFSLFELPPIALPLFVVSVSILAITELHIWILGYYRPEEDVALYGASVRLMNLAVAPLLIINSIIPATIAELYVKGDMNRLEYIARISATVCGLPAAFVIFGIILFSGQVMSAIFGDFYSQASTTVAVLALGNLVNILVGSPGAVLIAANKERVVMNCSIISGFLGLSISFFGVQSLQVEGIALGVASGTAVFNITLWWYCKKYLNIRTHGGLCYLLDVVRWAKAFV